MLTGTPYKKALEEKVRDKNSKTKKVLWNIDAGEKATQKVSTSKKRKKPETDPDQVTKSSVSYKKALVKNTKTRKASRKEENIDEGEKNMKKAVASESAPKKKKKPERDHKKSINVSSKSHFGRSQKKRRNTDEDYDSEDVRCLYCDELFSESLASEQWIRCTVCGKWAHQACAGADYKRFVCDVCRD